MSASVAAGDDGLVAPQVGEGAEDGAAVAVGECEDVSHGELLPGGSGFRSVVRTSWWKACRSRPVDAVRPGAGSACSGRNGRSVHGGCGGPVLVVEVAHLGVVVEVVVRHVRVGERRRDHDEPEGGFGERRGRPAVDVRQCERCGDVDVPRVDVDGLRCALAAASVARGVRGRRWPCRSRLRTACRLRGRRVRGTARDQRRRRPRRAGQAPEGSAPGRAWASVWLQGSAVRFRIQRLSLRGLLTAAEIWWIRSGCVPARATNVIRRPARCVGVEPVADLGFRFQHGGLAVVDRGDLVARRGGEHVEAVERSGRAVPAVPQGG